MKRITVVQHTQSVHHTNGMVGSWTDWELTETGRQQADNIGRNLIEQMPGEGFVIYSSDLLRAKQTAEIIGRYFGAVPLCKTELRERNLGRCCGRSVRWLRENMERPEKTIDDRLFSDAESRRDVYNRLKPFFDSIISDESENILIVSHGDTISVFNTLFLGLAPEFMNDRELSGLAGGVSQMYIGDDNRRYIKRLNDMSFMQEPQSRA